MCRFLAGIMLLFLPFGVLHGLDPKPPLIKIRGAWLTVDLWTDAHFPLRVIGAIDDGIRIHVVYEYRLVKKSGFFLSPDSTVVAKSVSWNVIQNLLEDNYIVRGSDRRAFIYRTRREYLYRISHWDKQRLCRIAELKTGTTYYLEFRVLVRSTRMYPPFSLLSVFSSETAWIRSGVIVP